MPDGPRRKVLLAVSGHDHKELFDWPAGTYELATSAAHARDLWDSRPDQWSAVVTVLEPGYGNAGVHGDTRVTAPVVAQFASGVALLAHVRASGGELIPKVAVVNGWRQWGPQALYAAAAVAWCEADVLDVTDDRIPQGSRLLEWVLSRATDDTDDTTLDVGDRSGVLFETLRTIEQADGRAGTHAPVGHAIVWLRALVAGGYMPRAVIDILTISAHRSGRVGPSSQPTLKKRMRLTFNEMIRVAEAYEHDPLWAPLPDPYPSGFWKKPAFAAPREFISDGAPFFGYEDLDPIWESLPQAVEYD